MISLGIESTAHTFGVAIFDSSTGKFVQKKDSYMTEKGGIIPVEAAKHHKNVSQKLLDELLKEIYLSFKDIDIISYSNGPGLSPCLLEGLRFTKSLAEKHNKPIVPVNHCIAHLEIGKYFCKTKDPVLLYVSGANTQIISYAARKYRVFGETLDMGIGNFIDNFARSAGLGFPGGPKIAELAKSGKYIEIPYSIKGMDVAFSGLLTNLKNKLKNYSLEDLSYSLQETAFAMLVEATERALAHLSKKEVLLGGGVACNERLKEMVSIMCKERGAKAFWPENQFLVDNAAMIAYTGTLVYKSGIFLKPEQADISPYQRTEQVEITWIKE